MKFVVVVESPSSPSSVKNFLMVGDNRAWSSLSGGHRNCRKSKKKMKKVEFIYDDRDPIHTYIHTYIQYIFIIHTYIHTYYTYIHTNIHANNTLFFVPAIAMYELLSSSA